MTETGYSEVPALISAFIPEYRQEHYHLHGRNIENWESLKSIFMDQHYEVRKFAIKVLKGALLGCINGVLLRNYAIRGPKSFELERIYALGKSSPLLTPLRGYTAFGAVLGATWWVIKDGICLPHGQDSFIRHIAANALMGGVLFASIVHPANFFYGCIAGAVFGGFVESMKMPSYPKNFELRIKSVDEETRRKLLREDEEYELSKRQVLTTRSNLYPL